MGKKKRAQGGGGAEGGAKSPSTSSTTAPSTSSSSSSSSTSGSKPTVCKGGGIGSSLPKPTLASVHEVSVESADTSITSPKEGSTTTATGGLGTIHEGTTRGDPESQTPAPSAAPNTYFGVRNYLHQFYGTTNAGGGSPTRQTSADENYRYLIRPPYKGPSACAKMFFKFCLSVGATFFLLGAMAIIIGYAIPRQVELRGENDEFKIIDRNAIDFNQNLDLCKLMGLGAFCSGGLFLVMALLTPTLANSYWDDTEEPFKFADDYSSDDDEDEGRPRSSWRLRGARGGGGGPAAGAAAAATPGSALPVTQKIKQIQPTIATIENETTK